MAGTMRLAQLAEHPPPVNRMTICVLFRIPHVIAISCHIAEQRHLRGVKLTFERSAGSQQE